MDQASRSNATYEVSKLIHNKTARRVHLNQRSASLRASIPGIPFFTQPQRLAEPLPSISSVVCRGLDGADRRERERVVQRDSGYSDIDSS